MISKWKSWDVINPEKYFGFVYKIINLKTGKFYIGKKVFWNNKKHKLTKKQLAEQSGPGRKPTHEVIRTESDWQKYWGSNKQLLADIKQYGEDNFDCWILKQCRTKKELTYYEMHYQCKEEVLIGKNRSYNDNILGKFFTKDLEA
jgi:hypothetical protein